MFKNIFSQKSGKSKTGFYKIESNRLIGIDEISGNGSINSVIEYLGYPTNHIHIIITFNSNKIDCMGFKTLSRELVFVLAKNKEIAVSFTDVSTEILNIDWSYEYSSLNVEDILNEGIKLQNFSLSFLKSVLDLRPEGENLFISNKLDLYFKFENELLITFSDIGFTNSSTKWLDKINTHMVRQMTEEARLYHNNEIDIIEEVNKQSQAILNIPDVVNNEFIYLHKKQNGNVNFYNLLLTHYTHNCNVIDFLFVNKGRYNQIDDSTYIVGNFIYTFDKEGKLDIVINN